MVKGPVLKAVAEGEFLTTLHSMAAHPLIEMLPSNQRVRTVSGDVATDVGLPIKL